MKTDTSPFTKDSQVIRKPLLYRFARYLLTGLIKPLLLDLTIEGSENLPPPPFILSANHFNWSDPLLLVCLSNHPTFFMGKAELFRNPFSSSFFRSLAGYPVKRGEIDRNALLESMRILKQKGVIVLLPEGTRSKTGEMGLFEAGAAYLSLKAGVPIVPVGIKGTYKVGIISFFIPKKHKFHLKVGNPLLGRGASSFKDEVVKLTAELNRSIIELIS